VEELDFNENFAEEDANWVKTTFLLFNEVTN